MTSTVEAKNCKFCENNPPNKTAPASNHAEDRLSAGIDRSIGKIWDARVWQSMDQRADSASCVVAMVDLGWSGLYKVRDENNGKNSIFFVIVCPTDEC